MTTYSLITAAGGAVVYVSSDEPKHYICPTCHDGASKIIILQPSQGLIHSSHICNNCKAEYPIDLQDRPQVANLRPKKVL